MELIMFLIAIATPLVVLVGIAHIIRVVCTPKPGEPVVLVRMDTHYPYAPEYESKEQARRRSLGYDE